MTYGASCNYSTVKEIIGNSYIVENEKKKQDFTGLTDKRMEKVDLPRGLYGYTYLLGDTMWINSSLDYNPDEKLNTMVHEASHTDDEQETRYRTEHKLNIEKEEDIIERLKKMYVIN